MLAGAAGGRRAGAGRGLRGAKAEGAGLGVPLPTERFDQRQTVFARARRGELGEAALAWALNDGVLEFDIAGNWGLGAAALSRAGFGLAGDLESLLDGPVAARRVAVPGPRAMSRVIKEVARYLGADLVGVTRFHPAFLYSHDQEGRPLASDHAFAVVVGRAMDYGHLLGSPDLPSGAATGKGYAEVAFIAAFLASYIRRLGYSAHGHRNQRVLQVPLAVSAGLGELGRCGFVVSARLGPRFRLASVTTDLPLEPDRPVRLGVEGFCRACRKCARACPSGAIPEGNPVVVRGVRRWHIDALRCFGFWVSLRERSYQCARCISACPWNKPDALYHRAAAGLVRRVPAASRALLWLDDALGFGRPRRAGGVGGKGRGSADTAAGGGAARGPWW
ncbi:MAG: 4Fe-4S dicluster domain-containing protein [Acetobacteraceae bacterium]|nr:4Fe-4S dicluster domain-containing protein [Acetobacteraceae bacterium]